ncbi:SH3 domain-containing protein [Novosphingobium sp. Chol11]|uniref:SH3 domain-containing protein n=1 Tax=Novosphingobium sp. Chol11 TaxID=1385763 RepID=UPI0025D31212|nr:SH3 domain-containing protein [Novosphingobium sp. Chol11]
MTRETELIVDPSLPALRKFTLSVPSTRVDPLRRPVRGDLAHIRCAGDVFVPHYAVPMPFVVGPDGASLHLAGNAGSQVLAALAGGSAFQALDIAGGWVWGQVGGPDDEDGLVGYVPQGALA